jgi:NitT/TauT family transport system permease protein
VNHEMASESKPSEMRTSRRSLWVKRLMQSFVPPAIGLVVILALWQAIVVAFRIPTYIFPTPRDIVISTIDRNYYSFIVVNAGSTIVEALIGFMIGAGTGFLLGVLFAQVGLLRSAVLPYLVASTTVPILAFAPIVVIWFGPGMASKIAVVAFLSFFPVTLGTLKGLQSTDRLLRDLFHCYAATRMQRFLKLELSYSLPYLFTTLRLSTPACVVGAIVAEFVAANEGLGYLIIRNWYTMDIPRLWATIFASCLSGIVLYVAMTALERVATPWHVSIEAER